MTAATLVRVHLHGALRTQFGTHYDYAISTPLEAGRALAATLKGFRKEVLDKYYRIVRGDPETGLEIGHDDLQFKMGKCRDLHVVPVLRGAKKGAGIIKVVLGAVFVGVALWATGGTLGAALPGALGSLMTGTDVALVGAGLALTGVAMMLAPSPKFDQNQKERPEDRASWIFTAPVNRAEEGGIVPIVYGQFCVGSVLASGSLSVERID